MHKYGIILEIYKFMFRFKYDLLPNVFLKYFLNTIQFVTITPEILLKVIIPYQESKKQLV